MGLPKLELPIHIIELPVSEKKIEIRPYVVKQEKSLLTSIDPDKPGEAVRVFKRLLEDCIVTKDFDISTLNIVDFYYIVLHIRMKSTGEVTEGMLECSECKKKTEFSTNLEDAIVVKNKKVLNKLAKINEDLSVRVVPSKIDALLESDSINVLDLIACSIDMVVIKKEIYKDFEKQELIDNILGSFTKMDYEIVSKGMEELINISIKFEYKCLHCGHINIYETYDITSI